MSVRSEKRARLEPWKIAVCVGILVALALLAIHGINKVFLGDSRRLGLDREGSIGTMYSVANFFVAATLCARAAATDRPRRGWWGLLALLFLAFSVDDLAGVHEASEDVSNHFSRLVLQPAVVGAGCLILVSLSRRLEGPAARLAKTCAFLLVLGFACSTATAYIDLPHVVYVPTMYVEELSEILMATALIGAALARPRPSAPPDAGVGQRGLSASAAS